MDRQALLLSPAVLLAAAALLAGAVTGARGAELYVSPAGDDGHTGLGPEPAQALRTIQAGVNKLQPGDTLFIRGGVYRETVTFPRSGEAGRPLTLKAYPGEKPLVSGCDPVGGWTRGPGAIWEAPMPWTLGLGRNQVFAGGEVLVEARFPHTPAPGLEMPVAGLSPLWPTFGEFSIPKDTGKQQPGRIVSKLLDGQPADFWKGALYYGLHYEAWCGQTGVIESSKAGEISVGERTNGWWFTGEYAQEDGRGMIVGHMHALTQPGEWVWQDNVLHLIPRAEGEPREVEAKRRQLAFDLSGRQHIRVEGLSVKAASVRMDGSAWCTFERCDLSYISHFTRQFGMGQVENGRDTIKSGETGIFVGGHDNAFLSCSVRISAGAGFHLRGYHHTIHNCLIDEVDYTSHYLNAITDAVGDFGDYENFLVGGHVITYNTMCNAGRHFFNFYGNGCSLSSRDRGPTDYMATLFAHNHLYNGMLQTRDAGFLTGYYCSGGTLDGLNSQVVCNVLHDDYDLFAMRIGALGPIYLDAGTCNVDVKSNLLWAAPGALQRALWFNTCCTDCSDQGNVFHPRFERTCAELTPEDFPLGRPFRFGHDFDNPPPVPAWPPLEARPLPLQALASHSAGVTVSAAGLGGLRDGEWFSFDAVDLDRGWQSVVMSFASDAKEMNSDAANRQSPRHRKATDPLALEATANDGAAPGVGQQWTFINRVNDGAWVRFNQVPLGEGYRRFRVVYGKITDAPAWAEVRLDSVTGPLVARAPLRRTDRARGGNIQIYAQATADLAPEAKGAHDVFVVFRSDDHKPVGEFEYFRFERARGQIPLSKSEVKIEVRVGSREGEKIGELYPRFTGGPEGFRDMVARLEPATGVQPLFFVVRSALGAPAGTSASLRLERAVATDSILGVGSPPRLDAGGRPIFPQPTNRPRSRPADRYAPDASAEEPRPLCLAARAPVAAADLRRTPGPALTLGENWDRSPAEGPICRAEVLYDDQALTVRVGIPAASVGAPRPGPHRWGVDEGVEIALQDAFSPQPGPVLDLRGFPDGFHQSVAAMGTPAEVAARLGASVTYQATEGDGRWNAQWRLPFAAAGFTPGAAPCLLFNVGVYRPAQRAWVMWRGSGGNVRDLAGGGLLVFPAEAARGAGLPRNGLVVWLDAAEAASVDRDAAGKVAAWRDRSGQGRDGLQAEAARRPLYVPAALNGRPALRFSETSRTRLDLPDLSDHKISATLFAVISNPEPGSEVNHDARIFTGSDGKGLDYLIGLCLGVPGMETGGPRVVTASFTDRWARCVRVGCFSPYDQTFFSGLISEILVFDRPLARDETARVRAYLAAKWGVE